MTILQATESWAGPGNEARRWERCLGTRLGGGNGGLGMRLGGGNGGLGMRLELDFHHGFLSTCMLPPCISFTDFLDQISPGAYIASYQTTLVWQRTTTN